MNKNLNIHGSFVLAFFLSVLFSVSLFSDDVKQAYVGSAVCGECHRSEAIGSQYDKWLRTPHAKAVLILKTESALSIAKKLSITTPSEDRQCLRCHTTGGGRHQKTITEGIGCEACHGPGGVYYEFSKHVDTVNRQGAYETALKNGMYPVLGIRSIKKREKLCRHCHDSRRPCYPTSPEEIYRQTISLQVISDLKKGDLSLKHQLIPPFPQY
ncbi:MAG: hypothetical protein A2176_05100 [Spirochaetes bacterium RBG_13_51_14]|nr:MAG: hypothetical protein A2176_05100 [Spirochaetes bacterium RBG_13_51_14]